MINEEVFSQSKKNLNFKMRVSNYSSHFIVRRDNLIQLNGNP